MRNALYRLIRKSPLVKVLSAMIVGVTALMAVSTPVTAEPLAVIEQTVYRFQDTLEGVKVVHEFRIANKGKSELNIVNVRGGWGCAATSYDRKILPGGEGKIEVTLNTEGYGGRNISESVRVFSDCSTNKEITLTLTGSVIRFAEIKRA